MAAMAQQLAACEAEYHGLREEYRAVTEDLSALVKDNQVKSVGPRSCCGSEVAAVRWWQQGCGGEAAVVEGARDRPSGVTSWQRRGPGASIAQEP